VSLVLTQFFGAANDNVLKQVLSFMIATGIWSGSLEEGGLGEGGQVVPALLLTLPFILLSGYAGQLADRFSKRAMMIVVRLTELPIAILAAVAFMVEGLWLALASMLLLATHSAFFGPAKYGVIPELVESGDLSRANGAINMLTNLAIIAGSLGAGPLADLYFDPVDPDRPRLLWAPGAAIIAIAVLGLLSVAFMPPLRAANPGLRPEWNPFATYVRALRDMARGPTLIVALAWSLFYMVGMMALLILLEYQGIFGITYGQNAILLGALAVSIGVGSVAAGLLSGHAIRPRLIPLGAIGMTVSFVLLGAVDLGYWGVAATLSFAGFSAGFYIIPLQALLQYLAPGDERGRFLGTANAMSFCFSSLGALSYWLLVNRPFELPPPRVFLACAALAIAGTTFALIRLRGYMTQEVGGSGAAPHRPTSA
jgi:acyl-[acyl-carrier-protein]-phospholipid O-acyltransferase/long-chain-fatty-acid--[acyl-carrier-protein] ligase